VLNKRHIVPSPPCLSLQLPLRELLHGDVATRLTRLLIPPAPPLSRQLFSSPAVVRVYPLSLAHQTLPFGHYPDTFSSSVRYSRFTAGLIGWCPWNSRSLDRRDAPRLQAGWRYCGGITPDPYGNARNSPSLSGSKSARHIPRPAGPSDALRPVEQDKGKRQQNKQSGINRKRGQKLLSRFRPVLLEDKPHGECYCSRNKSWNREHEWSTGRVL
jgi:hypothetical protein